MKKGLVKKLGLQNRKRTNLGNATDPSSIALTLTSLQVKSFK